MLTIAQLGQPILRRVAEAVPAALILSSSLQDLLIQMIATMEETGGVGLAAPQVFASLRVFLAQIEPPRDDDEPRRVEVFINPSLTFPAPEQESAWEGCLSFPELMVRVPRFTRARIEYLDARGECKTLDLEGFAARVVQHEYDHLDGIVTLDRAVSTRDIIKASELHAADGESEG